MGLPRVVVTLTERDAEPGDERRHPAGWTVDVRCWRSESPLVPPYCIDARVVDIAGTIGVVPVVPPQREVESGAAHYHLCSGDTAAISGLLDRLDQRSGADGDATLYGRWLFQCLLAPAWRAILALPDAAASEPRPGVEIALQWPASATDLHRLVWEAMHDGEAPLVGHPQWTVAITRLVPVEVTQPDPLTRLPKVLFAVGAPLTDDVIRPGAMFVGLLQSLVADGVCVSRVVEQVGILELEDNCKRFQPDVVHIVAHGDIDENGSGRLGMTGESGAGWFDATTIGNALAAGGLPMAVVLSACRAGGADGPPGARPMAAHLVALGIPVVSAMAGEIGEQACRLYTRKMATAIHAGEPVAEAAAAGRRAAMLRAERSDTQLDWAMPAMFMASSIKPGYRAVDPSRTRTLLEVADELDLRRQPVFVGRGSILDKIAESVDGNFGKRRGFVAVCASGSLSGLGSKRLLREVGFRMLRSGHIPLLLGPFTDSEQPRNLRSLLVHILRGADEFTLQIRRPPISMDVLAADPDFAGARAVGATALDDIPEDDARILVSDTLTEFANRDAAVDPYRVKSRLAVDLRRLAETAAASGPPFGEHTRVVVLGMDVHRWVGALEPFLSLIGVRSGLGTTEHPTPVVVTASTEGSNGVGPQLKAWIERNLGRDPDSCLELLPMPLKEAAMGFQWVLLHPWKKSYPEVYTAARGLEKAIVLKLFQQLDGKPSAVDGALYLMANTAAIGKQFSAQNDDDALAEYAGRPRR